ncbi:MAG: DUF2065 domain-containing protein [Pseudomonadota bacterium]
MLDYWLLGLAMMLVIEGLWPFMMPELWRETFRKMVMLSDGQLRFIGITAMLSGIILLYWIK